MVLECPKCHATVPDDAPDEVVRQKFYRRRAGDHFWVCLDCTRAFHARSGTIVS